MQKAFSSRFALPAALAPMALCIALPIRNQVRQAPDFATDVAPIFRAHCTPCHLGGTSGGLSLESYESLLKGGASGLAVSKGASKVSLLVRRILGEGGLPRMPMGFKPLSDHDVALIQGWIDAGALSSRGVAAPTHWAFAPPKRPKVPAFAKNPIDAFILEKLRPRGMQPNPPADRATLIRRVTLDLIGLPPTPAEVASFLVDRSPGAYEKVVDRLLASPHYGERMALPWLDAARYADSNGFQQDGDTYQYVWRDWVVRAYNANMPFDEFTLEQLAGDLFPKPSLDNLVATAFNRNHMLNGEGGAIPEEQRFVNLFDRVDTTALTWMGLTMGCTRCHDHKYDPLTQRDYYSMMAYFNRVPETGVPSGSGQYRIAEPWVYAGTPAQMAEMNRAEGEVDRARGEVKALLASSEFQLAFKKWREEVLEELEQASVVPSPWSEAGRFTGSSFDDAFARAFDPEKGQFSKGLERPDLKDGQIHPLSGDNTAFYFVRTLRASRAAWFLLSLGSDDGIKVFLNGSEVFSRKVTRAATPDSDRVIVRLRPEDNVILLKIVNGGGPGGFYFKGSVGGIDDSAAALARSSKPEDLESLKSVYASSSQNLNVQRLQAAVVRAEESLAKAREGVPRVMVMSDAKPRETHILRRGNYEEPLDLVEPDTPLAFPKATVARNRLGLAKWIVSRSNPLTARVQVNRAWQLFFGRGLVRTEENFGVKGEPPTHPELLDWLAVDLMEHGWNMKRLHKQIVMSAAYCQSSKVSPDALRKDPENRFYARGSRFRLPAQILRDVALAASGLLDPRIGGQPVYPYQPMGIWDGLAITLERDFSYPQAKGKDNYRRSLYTFWRRTAQPGNMFDSSSRKVCTVKPLQTSSPLHALTMLNDVTWVECGAAMSDSLMGLSSPDDRLKEAFFRICSRRPKPDELAVLKRALKRSQEAFLADPAAAVKYLTQGEYRPKRLTAEAAALAAVCVAIYNLDEAMTRE